MHVFARGTLVVLLVVASGVLGTTLMMAPESSQAQIVKPAAAIVGVTRAPEPSAWTVPAQTPQRAPGTLVAAAGSADGVPSAAPTGLMPTYEALGTEATAALLHAYYNGNGLWRDCPKIDCWVHNGDWGSDSLTDTLYLRWLTARDASVPPVLAALSQTARLFKPSCEGMGCLLWSDVPMWDSIADSREHEVAPGDGLALRKAQAAFWAVEGSAVYDLGACPAIRYQRPFGRGDRLKTLETDSNGVKAAMLLFGATHDRRYLEIAITRYRAIRRYFLDEPLSLYTVYVFDDGKTCRPVQHRYFASVNGNMIWNGIQLYRATAQPSYRDEAIATARSVVRYLDDPNGVFSDLQAENDLEEPLVEAMFVLATQEDSDFARAWLLTSASAAFSARKSDGTYGRFFDGPPPDTPVTAWQTNGGLATEIVAASLDPAGRANPAAWSHATFMPHDITALPATIRFRGSGIALIGTIGEVCCQPGHARILVDGVETMNRIGTWQNKSSSGRRFPHSVLFAWRWPDAGPHEVTFLPGTYDAKEGGTFLHAQGYFVL